MSSDESQPLGHALHTPDLLWLICDRLDLGDRLSLMKTSKKMFFCIVSEVWREVEAQVLIDLIVETASEGNMIVDFSRFDIYAPFVKQLRVYGRTARYFVGERRRASIDRAQLRNFLPNAASVTLLTSDLYHDSDALFWLELFLTPALKQLCIHPIGRSHTAWVCDITTRNLMERLVTNCPALETLEFYPMSISRVENSDNRTNMLWSDCPRPSLNTFCQLRSVSTSIGMAGDHGLEALCALPRLRTLSIRGGGEFPLVIEYPVPSDAFLCLTHLALVNIDVVSARVLLGVERLVHGITHLRITVNNEHQNYTRGSSESFTHLLKHCHRLKSFHYDARRSRASYGFGYTYSVVPQDALEAMSRLPLEQVTLLGLSFNGSDRLPHLALSFPRLVKLHIDDRYLQSTDLHWFARIPRLRDLTLGRICCTGLPSPQDLYNSPLEYLACAVTRETHQRNTYTMPEVARFFLALWPNLRRVSGGRVHTRRFSSQHSWFTMNSLNDEIARMRDM